MKSQNRPRQAPLNWCTTLHSPSFQAVLQAKCKEKISSGREAWTSDERHMARADLKSEDLHYSNKTEICDWHPSD